MKTHLFWLILAPILYSCSGKSVSHSGNPAHTPEEVVRLLTSDLLSRSELMLYDTEEVKALHYAEACAAYGAIKASALLKDQEALCLLTRRYDRIISDSIVNTANHVDANVYGILPLELYLHTRNEKDLMQGLAFADGQWVNPTPEGLSSQTRFWIDDVYMINSLQVQAYRATGQWQYLERAALETDAYIAKLQQENGLFHHGVNAPFFWGRGNGWVAAGLAELLSELPESNPHYATILNGYRQMMQTLLEYQSDDGMWHQLIDKPASFKETSSSAMFGFAISMGVKHRLLPEEPYRSAYLKAWAALTTYIEPDGKVREVCVGTGQSDDTDFYLTRPRVTGDLHGQAPLLWFAFSLLERGEREG